MTTAYRLAKNPGDYAAAQALAAKEGFIKSKMSFPTVLAVEDNQIVGVLATQPNKKMVVAGPMVLRSDRRRPRCAIRLTDLYDLTMRHMEIRSYIFFTEVDSVIDKAVQKLELGELYASRDGKNFYIRRLN